jgi:hypothetical protein
MDKKFSIGKSIQLPVMTLIYSLVGILAASAITMYGIQRIQKEHLELPAQKEIERQVNRRTRKLQRELEESRRINVIDDDIENPVYPL